MELVKRVEGLTVYGDRSELSSWILEEVMLNHFNTIEAEYRFGDYDTVRECDVYEFETLEGNMIEIHARTVDGEEWSLNAYEFSFN